MRSALKEQYHAGLTMFGQCLERCPEELWTASNPPASVTPLIGFTSYIDFPRPFWKIAFHNIYFTHLYLGQGQAEFQPPPPELAVRARTEFQAMWQSPMDLEPYDLPENVLPVSKLDLEAYTSYVDGLVDSTVDNLDLETSESGFPWYKRLSKMSHQLLNLRHLQGHVGQLSELLMMNGIDIDWK